MRVFSRLEASRDGIQGYNAKGVVDGVLQARRGPAGPPGRGVRGRLGAGRNLDVCFVFYTYSLGRDTPEVISVPHESAVPIRTSSRASCFGSGSTD